MGTFVQHVGCPSCDSRDNLGIYKEENDDYTFSYNATCFGCGHVMKHEELIDEGILDSSGKLVAEAATSTRKADPEWVKMKIREIEDTKPFKGMPKRKITASTLQLYNVRCEWDEEIDDRVGYYFPSYRNGDGEVVGWKYKPIDKNEDGKYDYRAIGSYAVTDELFGQNSFSAGGRVLVITTGQEDAMAFYEALSDASGGKYETPCVSLNNGDKSVIKQFKSNYKYISSFEKVILAFDNDERGQEAVEVACRLLRPGQAHIAKLNRYKDACEYKKRNLGSKLVDIFHKAERYSPIEIESLGSFWGEFANTKDDEIIPFPPEMVTACDMLGGGPAKGEVTVIGALTSIGKSTLINRIAYHASIELGFKTGLMYLESSGKEIVRSFLSMYSKVNLAVQKLAGNDLARLKSQFDAMINDDSRVMIVNHHGAFRSIDDMTDKLRWMAHAGDCELIIVDPLQAAVPSNSNELVDEFMDAMLKLAKETNVAIIVVSHMRKPEGKDPHDVDEYSLKGCVDKDTEFLTENGWVSIDKYNGEKVAVYDTKTENVVFEEPVDYVVADCETFNHFHSDDVDMVLSDDHRMIFKDLTTGEYRKELAKDVVDKHWNGECGNHFVPTCFNYDGGEIDMTDLVDVGKTHLEPYSSIDGKMYCFTTSTGAWIARRNGCIFATGNSSSINQIAFNTLLMSRDKVHPNPKVKHSTKLTLVKCRRTGNTGDAGWLGYNPETVELFERSNPYQELEGDEECEFYMGMEDEPVNNFGNGEEPPPWDWDE